MQSTRIRRVMARVIAFIAISVVLINLFAKADQAIQNPSQDIPGIFALGGTGIAISIFAGLFLNSILKEYNLQSKTRKLFLIFNVIIILLKFTVVPISFYESPELKLPLEINGDPMALVLLISGVFILYFLGLSFFYLISKRTVRKSLNIPPSPTFRRRLKKAIWIIIAILIICAIIPPLRYVWWSLLILYYLATGYLGGVFSSAIAFLLIAVGLGFALHFVNISFLSGANDAIAARNIAVLSALFWIGALFLFLYHGLWVVYAATLTSIWPLSVITPK